MTRVRITAQFFGDRFHYYGGEEVEVPEAIAKEWIRLGRADRLSPKVEAAVARQPELAVARGHGEPMRRS